MARYFGFSVPASGVWSTIDFPTNAEYTERKEYYEDFVLGGSRDKRVFGVTEISNEINVSYDLNGLKFIENVLGTINASSISTITADVPVNDYYTLTEEGTLCIKGAKVNTWELVIETGEPVTAEFNAIGTLTDVSASQAFTPNFSVVPLKHCDCSLSVDSTINSLWTRINLEIDNAIEPIYKTCTVPVDLREAGLEVTGALRAPEFYQLVAEGSMEVRLGTVGTIVMPNVQFQEESNRVEGFDLPETEISFTAYPTASTNAVWVKLGNTIRW